MIKTAVGTVALAIIIFAFIIAMSTGCASYKGQPYDAEFPPVKFAPNNEGGADVAVDVFTVWQNPANYTWGEWTTVAIAAGGIYYMGKESDWFGLDDGSSSEKGARRPSSSIDGSGGNTFLFGDINDSSVFIQAGSNDPQGNGNNNPGQTSSFDGD